MAEAKKADSGNGEQPPPKKKSKLLLIIVIIVVLVAAVGGGVVYLIASKRAAQSLEEGDGAPVKEAVRSEATETKPIFVKLDPFTVKLQTETQEAYLQVVPELRVLNEHVGEEIKTYMPEIRHKVLLILAGKKASDLSSPQGVQQLSNEMRVTINAVIEPMPQRRRGRMTAEPGDVAAPDDPVQEVLFTSFIVQ
jgi:flagellar protein FliL